MVHPELMVHPVAHLLRTPLLVKVLPKEPNYVTGEETKKVGLALSEEMRKRYSAEKLSQKGPELTKLKGAKKSCRRSRRSAPMKCWQRVSGAEGKTSGMGLTLLQVRRGRRAGSGRVRAQGALNFLHTPSLPCTVCLKLMVLV